MGEKTTILQKETNVKVEIEGVTASTIYEGGNLTQINAEELIDNKIAIKQLINNHNLIVKENANKEKIISSLNAQIEYLKTTPFISIVVGTMNIAATIIVGLGVNLLTSENPKSSIGIILIVTGGVLLFGATLASIFYPYARGWFNRKK